MEKATRRICPCCGQLIGFMTDDTYRAWLVKTANRLRSERREELAEALVAITTAIACEPVE